MCVCLLNITIKVGLSLGIILILFSQIHPGEMINEINKKLMNKNISYQEN